ncbi:MAG: hypothetical protein COT81_04415 [Candidatus Buchananbacteria bacterium CG10_big_fil_rev_8_21_14_0_10_42_9]|uniref:Uncharacterized protein n=1 Tax=Candidatus Buchananbacteria bacterium CG10_big_fil_rev_8_21_14_0_10_42_9 TaxID=1974526 RepID=A0A2H0W2L6_9BACT|nr:MAG: hypothetical protein COT81_04415 [Candidatus Buchananbacteria bacterium CG10_big_fil_rev_8_21_14_0_10_42_9]
MRLIKLNEKAVNISNLFSSLKQTKILLALILILPTLLISMQTLAVDNNLILNSLENTRSGAEIKQITNKDNPALSVAKFLSDWANGLIAIMALLFTVIIIYGGWLWMTAQGNEEQVTHAKNLIITAFIGFIVIFSARLIATLVIAIIENAYST